VVSGRLVLMAVCITEDERMETDPKNSWIRWDYSDGEQRTHINLVNKTFIYALLGDTGLAPGGASSVALVLAPAGNGNFMRIGLFFHFDARKWELESRVRRRITII